MTRLRTIVAVTFPILALLFALPAAQPGPQNSGQDRQRPTIRHGGASSPPAAQSTPSNAAQNSTTAIVPRETVLEIRLSEAVSSKENEAGDEFEAIVDKDIRVGGVVVIPRKSIVFGKLVEVRDSGRVKGRAKLSLTLTKVVVRGEQVPLHTNTLEIEADGSKGSDAKKIGAGAGIGGLLGGIFGGGGGLLTGTVIGAGAGTAGVLLTKGKDVSFGPEHRFAFRLEESLEVNLF